LVLELEQNLGLVGLAARDLHAVALGKSRKLTSVNRTRLSKPYLAKSLLPLQRSTKGRWDCTGRQAGRQAGKRQLEEAVQEQEQVAVGLEVAGVEEGRALAGPRQSGHAGAAAERGAPERLGVAGWAASRREGLPHL
jgi:hypothetical protein